MAGNDSPRKTDDPGARAASAPEPVGSAAFDPPVLAVGVGPGNPEFLTERAVRTVAEADAIVGFEFVLDVVRDRTDATLYECSYSDQTETIASFADAVAGDDAHGVPRTSGFVLTQPQLLYSAVGLYSHAMGPDGRADNRFERTAGADDDVDGAAVRLVIVAGTTETARIDGISAAGADPALMRHTPGADLDVVVHGEPTLATVVPVSPTGCPTPAVATRAARELLGFDVLAVDAGVVGRTGAPSVDVGFGPGADLREEEAVPQAAKTYANARELGAALPDERLVVGETIPGGTTTALGVLTALGEEPTVSSSLPENPLDLKRRVVAEGLDASGLDPGDAAGDLNTALEAVGDPVLAAVAGLTVGAVESGTAVTLAGGTQLAAAAALVRHAGVKAPLTLATTSFVADDDTAGIADLAATLDLELRATDPGFAGREHPAMAAYAAGEAKEGVGMGGALALVRESDASMAEFRERLVTVYDRLLADGGVPGVDGAPASPAEDG
jgi:uncharacterized protein (TIGR00303 family)